MLLIKDAAQIHAWDQHAMEMLQVDSLSLMELAATAFVTHFVEVFPLEFTARIDVLCGPGNNGGDGAAIARLLEKEGYTCTTYGFCASLEKRSPDLVENWNRLVKLDTNRVHLNVEYKPSAKVDVVIDALFGVSIDRPLTGAFANTVEVLNTSEQLAYVMSVDVPSGQKIDGSQPDWLCVQANETVTFAAIKQSAIFEETADAWGTIYLDDLGFPEPPWKNELSPRILDADDEEYASLLSPRRRFTHKGSYGHVLIIAGSRGHAGAALLSGIAAYRSGCGLVTFYVPSALEQTMQTGLPEAMCLRDSHPDFLSDFPDLSPYDAIVIGPGIGTLPQTEKMLLKLFASVADTPIVIDADALNLIAGNQMLFDLLPAKSILSPHPGEFARLADRFDSDFERYAVLQAFAKTLPRPDAVIVLKDQYTTLINQKGEVRVNFFDGNPGMATGGMGDTLAGVVASLAAQGMAPFQAAGLGVLLHARAGDLAAQHLSESGLLAKDVAERVGIALQQFIENQA